MIRLNPLLLTIAVVSLTILSGCGLIEGIFKIGFWAGIIIFALVIGLIVWIFKKIG